MRMQDAPHLAIGYEGRQLPLDRALDLAASLAQLGLNEWQTKRCVDVFFASRCEHVAPAPQVSFCGDLGPPWLLSSFAAGFA
jgi:hypothetical protein